MSNDGGDGHHNHHQPFPDPYSRSRYHDRIDSKIVVMGNSGVGKTSLLQRYTQNTFDPRNTTSTSGAFFVPKKVDVNGVKVRLQLWDTAGQERFRSLTPLYYRGANAALLLYDITNLDSFQDVRGWLEELKSVSNPDMLIYIVGAKADLSAQRQVTSDLARLSLHNWFPPPRKPTPPPPPSTSLGSYIRPRFTSFPGLKSPPLTSSGAPASSSPPKNRGGHSGSGPTSPEAPAYLDLPPSTPSSSSSSAIRPPTALQRSRTNGHALPVRPRTANSLTRSNTTSTATTSRTPQSSRFGFTGGYDNYENSSNSIEEEDESGDDEREWGLSKGMELFEVSAKDDSGIETLFNHLIAAIIQRKDTIEKENDMRKRDSVFLSNVSQPAWSAQADEEEAREKARQNGGSWSCC